MTIDAIGQSDDALEFFNNLYNLDQRVVERVTWDCCKASLSGVPISNARWNGPILYNRALAQITSNGHDERNHSPQTPKQEPGWFTYMTGAIITGLGIVLCETPVGSIFIGVGAGMMGSGISMAGEAKRVERKTNRDF